MNRYEISVQCAGYPSECDVKLVIQGSICFDQRGLVEMMSHLIIRGWVLADSIDWPVWLCPECAREAGIGGDDD